MAGTSLGALGLSIRADQKKLKGDLASAQKTTDSFAGKMQKRISSINFKAVGIAAAAAATGAVYALQRIARESISLAKIQEDAEKRLETVIRSTGQAAGFTAKEMFKMAAEFQNVTKYGDETTISAMAVLATFKNLKDDVFPRTMEAAMDVATVMGQDLQTSVLQLGKALNDPIANLGALGRVGIQFSKDQKDLIKSLWAVGNEAAAQGIILKEIESQYGGTARAARDTFGGALDSAKGRLNDLKEEIGFAITKNETFIDLIKELEQKFISWTPKIKEIAERFAEWTQQNKELIETKIVDFFTGLWEVLKVLVIVARAVVSGFMAVGKWIGETTAKVVIFTEKVINAIKQMKFWKKEAEDTGKVIFHSVRDAGNAALYYGEQSEKAFNKSAAASKYASDGIKIDTESMHTVTSQFYKDLEDEAITTWTVLTDLPPTMLNAIELNNRLAEADFLKTYDKIEKDTVNFAGNASGAISDGFFDVVTGEDGMESVKKAWEGFLEAMLRQIIEFLASKAVMSFIKFITSKLGSGGGGFIPDFIPILGQYALGTIGNEPNDRVPETGIYGLHAGEIVLSPEQADAFLASGLVNSIGGGDSGGGGEDSAGVNYSLPDPDATTFGRSFTGNPTLPADITARVALGGLMGGVPGAMGTLAREGLKAGVGYRGQAFDIPAILGQMFGGIFGGFIGPLAGAIGDAIGDLFDARSAEGLRDFLKDNYGYKGGRLGFAESFYDKIGTPADPFGLNQQMGVLSTTYGNFIKGNVKTFAEMGVNVEMKAKESLTEILGLMGYSQAVIDASTIESTTTIDQSLGDFTRAVVEAGSKFSANTLSEMSALESTFKGFSVNVRDGIGRMNDQVDSWEGIVNDFESRMDEANQIGHYGDYGELGDIGGGDFSGSDEGDAPGEAENTDPGGYGGGYAIGSWFTKAGGRTHGGEIVVPRPEADYVRQGKMSIGGQDGGRPINIVLQIGKDEWAANVNAINDTQRIRLERRPVGSRRVAY